jgi:hypothetical protein
MLQARQSRDVQALTESAKLVKAMGEPLRALQELESSLRLCGVIGNDVIDVDMDDNDSRRVKAKVCTDVMVSKDEKLTLVRRKCCAHDGCGNLNDLKSTTYGKSSQLQQIHIRSEYSLVHVLFK